MSRVYLNLKILNSFNLIFDTTSCFNDTSEWSEENSPRSSSFRGSWLSFSITKNICCSYQKLTFTALLCIYNMVIAIYQLYSHQLLIDAQKKSFSKHFRLKDMHPTNILLLKWIFKGRILKSIFLLLLGINC